ncbi:MAG TPA: outer membrane lipoprotein carrier protein LolA [Vicinamibacterales bacterium]|nr:outer membrane lipoprotein carrier protein LolA [Vicinamibacterales bacterium]
MLRPSALAACATAVVCAFAWRSTAAASPDLFDDIYARSHAIQASLKTVTARFTETTTTKMLVAPLVSHGDLAVVRPDRIVLRYTDPEAHVVLIDGAQMTLSWPSRGIVQKSDIGAARKRIDKYFVGKAPDDLRQAFRIAAALSSDPPNTWQVTMDPTRSQIKQGLAGLRLWIDRTSLLLTAMQMDFPDGDRKLMTFDDVRMNTPVDEGIFLLRH